MHQSTPVMAPASHPHLSQQTPQSQHIRPFSAVDHGWFPNRDRGQPGNPPPNPLHL